MTYEEGPYAVFTQVCGQCGEDWGKHLNLAYQRAEERWDELYVGDGYVQMPDEYVEDPTLYDCIELLKNKNRGPTGPVGPTGAMGMMPKQS